MKKASAGILLVLAAALVVTCTSSTASTASKEIKEMKNEQDSLSYALGVLMGGSLKGQGFDLDKDAFTTAFFAAKDGESLMMDEQTANGIVQSFQMEQAGKKSAAAKAEGIKFLEENGKRDGVTTTASGLQYEVLTEGTGASPVATDEVTVHYTGKLLDGKVFDSSVERGQPATFGLNQVIRGWTEGVQLMKEGAKYRFFIPSELAYGERGAGADIGPGATLIFDVELIKVNN